MINKNRKCICCGKEYSYCSTCSKHKNLPSWMTLYCGDNCKTIFCAANDVTFGLKTAEEAKEIIETCDLSNLETFNETVKNDVKKILATDIQPKKASKKVAADDHLEM